ncbi:MAG TPA: nodulation protein NfeD [Hyphomicrobiaceae bacterium]|nr:nodulation protein NfeD [Hyphomicrobiaceae bacterium]
MRRRPLLLFALFCAWLAGSTASGRGDAVQTTPEKEPVLLIDVKGAIGFVSTAHLERGLQQAKAKSAPALVMRLDTPGGLVSSTRDMINAILASPVPVVIYVAPSGARAASAGAYLAYAAHIAAMAPATHIGAATPVQMGAPGMPGSPPPNKPAPSSDPKKTSETEGTTAMERKIINDAVAYIRSLAELRNRNADWAERAVREAATLTATDALKEGVVDVVAGSVEELLAAIDGRTVKTATGVATVGTKGRAVRVLEPTWNMRVLAAIADPNIAFVLLLIGIYGIIFEFMNPGAIAPGVIGGICLIVALTALSVLPVSYGGLALLILGIGLMLVEILSPGFGLLGIGGIIGFVLGALFLFDPADSDIDFSVDWHLLAFMTAITALFFFGALTYAVRARQRPVRTGAEQMIGATGEVVSWSNGEGRVHVHGEIWAARGPALAPGTKIRVVQRENLTLIVVAAN